MLHIYVISTNGKISEELESALRAEDISLLSNYQPNDSSVELDGILLELTNIDHDSINNANELSTKFQTPLFLAITKEVLPFYDSSWGGQDFLTNPYHLGEFTARIKQKLDNVASNQSIPKLISSNNLTIDTEKYEVFVGNIKVMLTYKEYRLLCILASNPGRVFSREVLLTDIWEYDYYGGTRTVDVHIRRLRSKIEINGNFFIETIRNVGYKFI
jgi:DNA-binding response OmpR family regulator